MESSFKSMDGQAFDVAHGVRIAIPGIGPGQGHSEVEYLYSICSQEIRDGLGLLGGDGVAAHALRIRPAQLVAAKLRIRERIGRRRDPFDFPCDLADGLICDNLSDPDVREPISTLARPGRGPGGVLRTACPRHEGTSSRGGPMAPTILLAPE